MIKQYVQKTIIFMLMTALFACAGIHSGGKTSTPLAERVNQFLQASVDENWAIAYTYFDSAFRNSISKEAFAILPRGMKLKSYAVDEINVIESGVRAEVNVSETITVLPQGFTFKDIKKKQIWVTENGQWMLTEPPITNPMQK
jgi:hypothetical protein